MATKRNERFPTRFEPATPEYPQGAFKDMSARGANDGSFLSAFWLKDFDGFFGALLNNAGIEPDGETETAYKSQYYDALKSVIEQTAPQTPNADVGVYGTVKLANEQGLSYSNSSSKEVLPVGLLKANFPRVRLVTATGARVLVDPYSLQLGTRSSGFYPSEDGYSTIGTESLKFGSGHFVELYLNGEPISNRIDQASTTSRGTVELATTDETATGTSELLVPTVKTVAENYPGVTETGSGQRLTFKTDKWLQISEDCPGFIPGDIGGAGYLGTEQWPWQATHTRTLFVGGTSINTKLQGRLVPLRTGHTTGTITVSSMAGMREIVVITYNDNMQGATSSTTGVVTTIPYVYFSTGAWVAIQLGWGTSSLNQLIMNWVSHTQINVSPLGSSLVKIRAIYGITYE